MVILVPAPTFDSMENSLESRLAPPSPRPRPVARGKSILQGLLDIGDAWALVLERQPDPAAAALFHDFEPQLAAAAIIQRVARKLAGGRDDLGLVDKAQARPRRPRRGSAAVPSQRRRRI